MSAAVETVGVSTGNSALEIAPARGGILTSLTVDGTELFYLDPATLEDPTKSVRGGMPILFPICGPLRDDEWRVDGRVFHMKQHGFARNLPWRVAARGGGSVTMALNSTEETRAQYPHDFEARFEYRLIDRGLHVRQTVENRGSAPMPMTLGVHPYFATDDNARVTVDVPATLVAQNPYGTPETRPSTINLEAGVDLCFVNATTPEGTLHAGRQIRLSAGAPYKYVVVWTQPGKPFCCVEPWTARGDALNTGNDVSHVAPGETLETWVEIKVAPA
ncbi:MAG: aldose epimerase [Armatimonadetes bacterium]|nr:aldose epimerase [Armatimonadota bacterium]